ncbi:undecaprenyl-diphosphate phosphatase [Bacillaceae bacterium W0354]
MSELIELLKYLLLGLFQGFTEPIPISSSGHSLIVRSFMDLNIPGITFEGFINFGSLIAVLIVYRKDLSSLAVNGSRFLFKKDKTYKSDFYYLFLLFIATIPAGLIGVLFEDVIGDAFGSESVKLVGVTLIITGIALWIIRNLTGHKDDSQITIKDAIIVGLAQAVALIPGISRSGATVVAAMLIGMKRDSALRFSFLLYIPVSIGTMIFSVSDIASDPNVSSQLPLYLVALVAAIVASYFALLWFIDIMKKGNLKYFAFYCFIVGALVFFLL